MALQDVRELTNAAQVGKFYLVPCIKVRNDPQRYLSYGGLWIPVVGGIHEDPEIKEDLGAHIHPDWRFVPEVVIKRIDGRTSPGRYASIVISALDIENVTPVLKRRKILREFKFPSNLTHILEPVNVGKSSGCSVCPHRGVSLAGLKTESDGSVICPGHGLRMNQKTGLVIKRG